MTRPIDQVRCRPTRAQVIGQSAGGAFPLRAAHNIHHASNGAIQVVHLLPCVLPPAIGDETEDELDTGNQPDTPDETHIPDDTLQDVPGLFEETTLSQFQDKQSLDTQELSSQVPDMQDQDSQVSRRSTRVRKLSAALEPYILG